MAEFTGRIGHLEGIESPWGNAGGVVKTVDDVEQMAHTGVGYIEAGSYTLEPRKGNRWDAEAGAYLYSKDWDYDSETGKMRNSLGMPNPGFDVVEAQIPEMARIARKHRKALIVNVAPVTDKPAAEAIELINRAYAAGADGVVLNAGCPNVKNADGTAHSILSKSPAEFWSVLQDIEDADISKPIWVRTSPQGSLANTRGALSAVRSSTIVSAILHTNTWPIPMPIETTGEPLLDVPVQQVGESGPAMAREAAVETRWANYVLRGTIIDVISSSGIMNASELKLRMELGAVAGAGTTFYYASNNGWKEDTDKLLSELAA